MPVPLLLFASCFTCSICRSWAKFQHPSHSENLASQKHDPTASSKVSCSLPCLSRNPGSWCECVDRAICFEEQYMHVTVHIWNVGTVMTCGWEGNRRSGVWCFVTMKCMILCSHKMIIKWFNFYFPKTLRPALQKTIEIWVLFLRGRPVPPTLRLSLRHCSAPHFLDLVHMPILTKQRWQRRWPRERQ